MPVTSGDSAPTTRMGWWVIVGGHVGSIFVYAIVLHIVSIAGGPAAAPIGQGLRFALVALAGLTAVAAVVWSRARLRLPPTLGAGGTGALPEAGRFQLATIVALSLANTSAILGFLPALLTRGAWRDYLPFGLLALAVDVLEIAPRGLTYWAAVENHRSESGGAPRGA